MQTPGRRVESLTPMIAINRRVNTVFERLSKVQEDIVEIERPQQRIFGRIISQFQILNNSMDTMEDLIREDIAAKKRYFAEESKILEKDSRNLKNINSGIGRQLLAGALGAYGVSQILQGRFGEGAMGVGGAAALLSPEILGFISTVVTTRLLKSGILGSKPGVGLGSNVAGASKLKNPLLITAALAASLILPGLMNNQGADRRRQIVARRSIQGAETINKTDVDRFRGILARFDVILSSISLDRKKRSKGTIDEQDIENFIEGKSDNKDNNNLDSKNDKNIENKLEQNVENDTDDSKEGGGFFEGIKNLFGIGKEEEVITEENEGGGEDTNISMIDNSIIEGDVSEGDVNQIDKNTFQSTNVAMGDINPDLTTNFSSSLGDLSFDFLNNTNISNNMSEGGEPQVINLNDSIEESTPPPSSGFSGITATPTFVSVGTRFESSGGAIDKLEGMMSLGPGAIIV